MSAIATMDVRAGRAWEEAGLASNGKPVRDNFAHWFGKSAVVDEQGAPKVLYHTTCNDFDAFTISHDLGYHFGSAAVARGRIKEGVQGRGRGEAKYEGLITIAAHLAICNPLRLDSDPITWQPAYVLTLIGERLPAASVKSLLEMDEVCIANARAQADALKASGGPGVIIKRNRWNDSMTTLELKNKTWSRILSNNRMDLFAQLRKDLQVAGFDGLTYINEVEGDGRGRTGRKANPDNLTWVAFEGSQIKSALANSGLYLKDSASMTDHQADRALRLAARARACIPASPLRPLRSREARV